MEFIATESGFEDGMGGASNAAGTNGYHYVLFGRQTDTQHPKGSGVYFEFDDQVHGSVDSVARVVVGDGVVEFVLNDSQRIVVRRGLGESHWNNFLKGIYDVFGVEITKRF